MLNFNMCVCGGGGGGVGAGGYFYDVVLMLFFEFRVEHQIIFLPNKQNLEEYFHRQHF